MKSAVIFDMDGTVIDSMGIYRQSRYEVLEEMGYTWTDEDQEIMDTYKYDEFVSNVSKLKGYDIDEDEFFYILHKKIRNYYRQGFPLKKGMIRFLDYLDENGIRYCIATASRNINAISVFKKLKMLHRFDFILTTSDVDHSKYYPTIYEEAAMMMDSEIENTYVFEDALYAVKTAKKGGFKVVGIHDEYFDYQRERIIETADHFIDDYDQLMDIIEAGDITFI